MSDIAISPRHLRIGLILIVFVQGCATFTPHTVGCDDFSVSRPQPPAKQQSGYYARGIRFLPPPEKNWCLFGDERWGALFTTTGQIGTYIEQIPEPGEVFPHFEVSWWTVSTSRSKSKDARIVDLADLQKFVEHWLRTGGSSTVYGNNQMVAELPATPDIYPDNTLVGEIHVKVVPDPTIDVKCVRFEQRYDMWGKYLGVYPPQGNWTYDAGGYVCAHPDSEWLLIKGTFVGINYGGRGFSDAWNRYRKEVEPMFRSLEFRPL